MTHQPYQLLPPLSKEDYASLEASIIAHGVLVPVEYDEAGNILDGHHRVAVCEALGLVDWPRFIRRGLSEPEKRTLARELNISRRHLSTAQKQKFLEDQLCDTPWSSDRAIAAMFGVDSKTAGAARRRLIEAGKLDTLDKTVGRDGRTRRIKTLFFPNSIKPKKTDFSSVKFDQPSDGNAAFDAFGMDFSRIAFGEIRELIEEYQARIDLLIAVEKAVVPDTSLRLIPDCLSPERFSVLRNQTAGDAL